MENKKYRILELDVIRFIALLCIIFLHSNPQTYSLAGVSINFGCLGVSIFIILSGMSLSVGSFKNKSLWQFYKKRFASILPYLWVGYFITTLLLFSFGLLPPHSYSWPIVFTFIGLDGYFCQTLPTYYLVGEWFTGFILLMYLVSPLVYRSVTCYPVQSMIVCAVISVRRHLKIVQIRR